MKKIILLFIVIFATSISHAQNTNDTTDGRFNDDLLNYVVGNWTVTGKVYGMEAKLTFKCEWILNHQFIQIHEKSNSNIPGTDYPFEALLFVGYDSYTKRYIPHLLSMYGGTCSQNTLKAYRTGNEFKLVITEPCVIGVERFTWTPATHSWHVESRELHNGKEGDVYLDLTAISRK